MKTPEDWSAACVFDVYGTLLDFSSAVSRLEDRIGPDAGRLSALWRQKQLEYSWLRSLMGRHTDFSQVTADALDFSLQALKIHDMALRDDLLALFRTLAPYPEVTGVLETIRNAGYMTAVLSNGDPETLGAGLEAAGIGSLFDAVYSVETVSIFKPHPDVYRIACDGLKLEPGEILFLSANGWDIAGAASFGFETVWVNRTDAPREFLPSGPANQMPDLSQLPALLTARSTP